MVVGVFVYAKDFDASYAGTGTYAFGSELSTWLVSALLVRQVLPERHRKPS